ncbi:MAG: ATP-binding protein [Anaerolineales bacterium]|nr:ATP-binding protein [Anaerolineales bacterium]
MNTSLAQFVLLLLLGALYLPVVFFVMQRREDGHGSAIWFVALYALLAMVVGIAEAIGRNEGTPAASFQGLQIYAALTLIAILTLTLAAFLKSNAWKMWGALWAGWMLLAALILVNAFNLPDTLWTNGSVSLQRARLAPAWAVLGWLIFLIGLIVIAANANKEARQQLFRNRLNYWWGIIFLVFVSDILLFSNVIVAGQPIRLIIAVALAYVICTHYLPDLRDVIRKALAYLLVALLITALYAAGFLLAESVYGTNPKFNPLIAGALIALLVSLFFAPLLAAISRALNAWLMGDKYDANRTIHQYSESISKILEMDKLANVAVGIIIEAMQIERGFFFLVDSDRQADGSKTYKLRQVRSPEEIQMPPVELSETGIIASYFIREQRPLLQYDLEMLPAFQSGSPTEKNWLAQLQTEVHIPIFAKKQWIGLLTFGKKLSGNRYTKEDLSTLSSHASQTAVALENARLVENLMRLNNELRQARRALEKNNRDLERIDQAKSDFISIASHELRTPLTVIKGYSEMLIEDPNLDPNFKFMMKKINEGALRLHEVMDSMFDIAQIDARALKPHIQPVELSLLLHEVCIEQADAVKERKQSLLLELPALPHVKADQNLLRKLFHHLLRNAVKFTDNLGKITITGRAIPPIIDLPHGGVEIIFSDTGVGVDPNFHEIIFTKFYQPGELGKHSTSKTRFKGGGAGLGLALSKGIVEAHGGRIWVESPGYDEVNFPGSQFHLILPLNKLEEGENQKTSAPLTFRI